MRREHGGVQFYGRWIRSIIYKRPAFYDQLVRTSHVIHPTLCWVWSSAKPASVTSNKFNTSDVIQMCALMIQIRIPRRVPPSQGKYFWASGSIRHSRVGRQEHLSLVRMLSFRGILQKNQKNLPDSLQHTSNGHTSSSASRYVAM